MGIEREISGRDERPEGQVRLTTYQSMGQCFLAPRLGAFRQRYPEIELQLNLDNRPLNLSRREADLAVRPGKPTQQALQVRKIGTVVAALYASPAYLKKRGEPRTVEELPSTTSSTMKTPTHTSRSRAGSINTRGARA